MIQTTWRASLSPGNEQANRWSSVAADARFHPRRRQSAAADERSTRCQSQHE
jgi:hypothetical protein